MPGAAVEEGFTTGPHGQRPELTAETGDGGKVKITPNFSFAWSDEDGVSRLVGVRAKKRSVGGDGA